jgi:hypothetical protein
MASTRATSRALRGPLEQVVVLAGYEAAGAEEMPTNEPPSPTASSVVQGTATAEQIAVIRRLVKDLQTEDPSVDWNQTARTLAGCPADLLTTETAAGLIHKLKQARERLHHDGETEYGTPGNTIDRDHDA